MGEVVIRHGPAGGDRSRLLFEERLEESRSGSPEFLYVVASRWRKQQLVRTFLQASPRTFEVPILTFQDLILTLFRELGSGRRVVSETGRRCLLEAALEEGSGSAEEAGKEKPAALSEAEAWVSQFKSRGLTNEPLIRLHLQREDRGGGEANRLVRIFLAYQKRLEEQGWEDSAGVRLSLYEALLTGSLDLRNRFPRLREILYEGIVARTPVERGLVRLLADQVRKTTFSLDLNSPDEEAGPFSIPLSLVQECWEGMNPEWRSEAAAGELPRVRFSRPADRVAEVRAVAREIQGLKIRRPHLRWSQTGVVCPRDDSYLLLLREVFSQLDIPWTNLHGDAVGSTNAFRVLMAYVELLWRDFRRDDLFDFLASPWIDPDGIPPDRIRLLEELAGEGGFLGGGEVWTGKFPDWIERRLSESPAESGSGLEGCAEAFRERVRQLQADPKRDRTTGEWVALLAGRLGPLLRPPDGPGEWGRTEGQALARLQASLQEAALTWGDCPLSLARFRNLLHRQVSRRRMSPSLDREAVVVGSARDLQECEFAHLYWLDFSEGRIPSRWRPLSATGTRVPEELSIFHGLRCRSRETVLLTSPRQGESSPVLPSHLLAFLEHREESLPDFEPALEESEDEARGDNIRRGIRALALRRSGLPGPFAGVLSRPHVLDRMRRRHFPAGMDLSPTQLEEYGRCGFRYFLRTMLKAESPVPAATDLLREQRRLVHTILARYSQEASADRSGDLDEGERRMAGILGEELERLRQARPTAGGLLWEQLQAGLMDGSENPNASGLLIRFLEEERERGADSELHSVEISLGPFFLGRLPSCGNSAGEPPVRLKGLPDRIERTSEGYRVVLYAAGRQERLRRIREGWGYRLPLSLLLVHSLVGKATSGGFYHVSPPGHLQWRPLGKRGRPASRGELDRLMGSYQEKALLAARGIHDGWFPVTTLKPASAGCSRCAYSRVCRRDEVLAGGTPA